MYLKTITATELARDVQGTADRINLAGEPFVVIKNSKPLFTISPMENEVDKGLKELEEGKGLISGTAKEVFAAIKNKL